MTAATTTTPAAHAATERPSALATYRDDGPLARALGARNALPPLPLIALAVLPLAVAVAGAPLPRAAVIGWLVLVAGLTGGKSGWAVPPALRAAEYGAILWLAGSENADAAFVALAAIAFRHYDLIYRLRDRASAPPAWVDAAALGWDGRLIVVCALALAGALRPGLFIAGGLLALLTASGSVAAWTRHREAL
jgi:hypothetical protein